MSYIKNCIWILKYYQKTIFCYLAIFLLFLIGIINKQKKVQIVSNYTIPEKISSNIVRNFLLNKSLLSISYVNIYRSYKFSNVKNIRLVYLNNKLTLFFNYKPIILRWCIDDNYVYVNVDGQTFNKNCKIIFDNDYIVNLYGKISQKKIKFLTKYIYNNSTLSIKSIEYKNYEWTMINKYNSKIILGYRLKNGLEKLKMVPLHDLMNKTIIDVSKSKYFITYDEKLS